MESLIGLNIFYITDRLKGPGTSGESTSDATEKPDAAEVNFTYEQVKSLLRLYNELTEAPEQLSELYRKLEVLGEEVSMSVEELRAAAENVLAKTKQKK